MIATLDPAEAAQVDLSPYPALSAYHQRMAEKDFYRRCFNAYRDTLPD